MWMPPRISPPPPPRLPRASALRARDRCKEWSIELLVARPAAMDAEFDFVTVICRCLDNFGTL